MLRDEPSLVDSALERVLARIWSDPPPINSDLNHFEGLYIYGAGDLGCLAVEYFAARDLPVLGVVDKFKTGYLRAGEREEVKIVDPAAVDAETKKTRPIVVAIATHAFDPIRAQLTKIGWRIVIPFYAFTAEPQKSHPLQNGWKIGQVSEAEKDAIDVILAHLNDQMSRAHYASFLSWHIDQSELLFDQHPIVPEDRYVISEFVSAIKHRSAQLVDVGSHRAEIVKKYSKRAQYFSEYILIEPDPDSFQNLSEEIRGIPHVADRFRRLNLLLGEKNTQQNFVTGLGYCSQTWEFGKILKEVKTLDSLALNPSLVKIHTEGTELSIIKGGLETIRRHKPCLVFSVYHKREGFYKDIAEPMTLIPSYKWYFRLHAFQGTGAFVYGVPQ